MEGLGMSEWELESEWVGVSGRLRGHGRWQLVQRKDQLWEFNCEWVWRGRERERERERESKNDRLQSIFASHKPFSPSPSSTCSISRLELLR